MKFGLMLVATAMAVAAPANAHWQWSRWGMTPAEVVTASKGAATRASNELSAQGDQTKGAEGTYALGDYAFKAGYWFKNDKLSEVELTFTDDMKCLNLERDLLAKYGQPVERNGSSFSARRMWSDRTSGNRVALITTSTGYCDLQYAPLVSEGASGL